MLATSDGGHDWNQHHSEPRFHDGALTLTGSDTLLHYQQALDNITYSWTSNNFGTDTSRAIRGW